MKKKDLWVIAIILITVGVLSSCSVWQDDLGKDLLPPGDNVFLFHDTIFEIHAYPVTGKPLITSDRSFLNTTRYLLGNLEDSIVGTSTASVFTQYNTTSSYRPGPNTEIDSIILYLYIEGYEGDMDNQITIRVHEATERIYMDSIYRSDFEAEGKFNPVILAEKSFKPADSDTVEFLIQDQAFIQKFLDVQTDSALFRNDSIFKDYFNGFYLTAAFDAGNGALARAGLSDVVSRMIVKYANDSTEIDSIAGKDFTWATFPIDEFYSQKINLFEHDHSMTYLSGIIDNDSVETPYCYVQGMAGVNTRLSFTDLEEWMGEEKVAINSATFVFEVVPEELSGIAVDDLPNRMMLYSELDDGDLEYLYDYYAIAQTEDDLFGGILATESKGMFYDTTYTYRFNMGLHFQSMIDGVASNNNFRLRLYDSLRNPKISKLWSNLSSNPKRIRLEVVYLKL